MAEEPPAADDGVDDATLSDPEHCSVVVSLTLRRGTVCLAGALKATRLGISKTYIYQWPEQKIIMKSDPSPPG